MQYICDNHSHCKDYLNKRISGFLLSNTLLFKVCLCFPKNETLIFHENMRNIQLAAWDWTLFVCFPKWLLTFLNISFIGLFKMSLQQLNKWHTNWNSNISYLGFLIPRYRTTRLNQEMTGWQKKYASLARWLFNKGEVDSSWISTEIILNNLWRQ